MQLKPVESSRYAAILGACCMTLDSAHISTLSATGHGITGFLKVAVVRFPMMVRLKSPQPQQAGVAAKHRSDAREDLNKSILDFSDHDNQQV
jgi:hypothetical protein